MANLVSQLKGLTGNNLVFIPVKSSKNLWSLLVYKNRGEKKEGEETESYKNKFYHWDSSLTRENVNDEKIKRIINCLLIHEEAELVNIATLPTHVRSENSGIFCLEFMEKISANPELLEKGWIGMIGEREKRDE